MKPRHLLAAFLVAAGVFAAFSLRTGPSRSGSTPSGLRPANPMKIARAAHTATLLADGTVLITGGFAQDREGNPFAEAELFDPEKNEFAAAGRMTTGRQSHTASVLSDGRVLIAGGWPESVMATSEIFDPGTDRFKRGPELNTGRGGHIATELADGRVLIGGGYDPGGRVLSSMEIYNPASGDFVSAGSMTLPRAGHTQTLLSDGTVLIAGGTSGRGSASEVLASAEVFDPETGVSTAVGPMETARYKHAAVSLLDGRVLIIAGSDDRDWRGRYDSAELYDPETRSFSKTSKLGSPRFKLRTAAARLPDGLVLIAGGSDVVEVFNPATDRFSVVPGRFDNEWFFSTVTALKDGRALIAGGYDRRIQSTRGAWLYAP